MLTSAASAHHKRPLNYRAALFALLFSLSSLWLGCAGTAPSSQTTSTLSVSPREPLFVALPAVPDSVDSLLSRLGWVPGRFAQELRKELVFQFQKKGIATVEDSAAKSTLALILKEYVEGGGLSSRFAGTAHLKTSQGTRLFTIGKSDQRAQSIERADPTVDNIRLIAESVVKETYRKSGIKKGPKSEFNPPMLMLF